MDLKGSETINSRPSWLQASTELMSKMWPSLSGVNTDEEKLQAYYIDQARNFGIEPPSKIKKQIREELRKAKNAHKKRKGKKHHLALAILSRWHLLAKLTVPKMREKLNREGVDCSEKAIENTLSRLNLDRPINRGRPSTDM